MTKNLLSILLQAAVVVPLAIVIFLLLTWSIVFHYVEPGELAVVVAKTGKEPPEGQLLAKPGEKGPMEQVLGEGRHFILPYFYDVEIRKLAQLSMEIPAGKIGVVTARVGNDLPPGQILAEPGQKGILRQVLPPGRHRLNPYGYKVELVDATIIQPGYVGFVTSLVGREAKGRFAEGGERGIRKDVLQPGIYYLNPREFAVKSVEVGLDQVSFLKKDQIRFPSDDAFDIRLDATVEWELHPMMVATVLAEFGTRTQLEEKVLAAQARSIGRLEGSKYKAKDFLLGEGRSKIQNAFTQSLKTKVREKHADVHSAYIRHITIPDNLLQPIRESFVAKEKERTARVQEETRRSAAELQRERSLITQRKQEVYAETEALVLKVAAEADRQVAKIEADTRKMVAKRQQAIAKLEAQRTQLLGEAKAQVVQMLGEANASRFRLQVGAFAGDGAAYARHAFASSLPEELNIRLIQTGEGTFWTDLGRSGALFGKLLTADSND